MGHLWVQNGILLRAKILANIFSHTYHCGPISTSRRQIHSSSETTPRRERRIGAWSLQETAKLEELIRKHGSFHHIPNLEDHFPGRTLRGINKKLWVMESGCSRWTPYEIQQLQDLIDNHGINRIPNIKARFPNRTLTAIYHKINALSPPEKKRKLWSLEEDVILSEAKRAKETLDAIKEKLPHRTAWSINKRWHGISSPQVKANETLHEEFRPYTVDEVAEIVRLRDLQLKWEHIGTKLKRPKKSVMSKYRLSVPPEMQKFSSQRWTAAEDSIIEESYKAGLTYEQIAEKIPHRGFTSVRGRLRGLLLPKRLLPWTASEDSIIEEFTKAGVSSNEQIASKLPGRTSKAVEHRKFQLREQGEISDLRSERWWTASEDAVIEEAVKAGLFSREHLERQSHFSVYSRLERQVPGRSAEAIKARKHRLTKKLERSVSQEA